jgi:arabinan endo-1,5-alpha-L-arabinosidase
MQRSRYFQPLPAEDPLRGDVVPVHDPSIIHRPDGAYIVFATDVDFLHRNQFIEQRCSKDLLQWRACGYVFQQMPGWVKANFPGLAGLWAPDISYYHGLYHLYYAASTLGSQHSSIGLATNPTLDPNDPRYGWTDRGEVLASHRGDDFNAIDANVIVERAEGYKEPRVWINYGSFWKGLFQQEIDPATGKLLPGAKRYHLAQQPADRHGAIEASAMIEHNGWYYLFASVGICCDLPIERDTYQEVVGRSRSLHGPFAGEDGSALLKGGGTILLSGDAHWVGPGGGSLWTSADGGETVLTFHALHTRENGALDLWVERVTWQDDWPVLRPLT